jgi:hypothetical protein
MTTTSGQNDKDDGGTLKPAGGKILGNPTKSGTRKAPPPPPPPRP